MKRILLGGSPCTKWSIAQMNNRETTAEGEGWELFLNYAIAKEKFKPDFFLYENNKSAAAAIKEQITKELGYGLTHINSALVSAQNRQRFYVTPLGESVPQPEDRGILLRDILEMGVPWVKKSYALTTACCRAVPEDTLSKRRHTMVAEPVQPVNTCGNKSHTLKAQYYKNGIANFITNGGFEATAVSVPVSINWKYDKDYPVYEVKNGLITIKDKTYPIHLVDGFYIIRKLTCIECERLQTMPDNYTEGVSNSQRYKMLGNGWTAEVIVHILRHGLKDWRRDEPLQVLGMYDGMATGRYCLEQLGFTNIQYFAYEVDKYAIQIAQKNYPDIIQRGDAFAVRNEGWLIPEFVNSSLHTPFAVNA